MHEQKEAINEKNDIPTPTNVMQMLTIFPRLWR